MDANYTQVTLIANTVYIYMVLLFAYIVSGVIIYGVKEYRMSAKDRAGSISSQKAARANWSENQDARKRGDSYPEDEKDLEALGSLNRIVAEPIVAPSMSLSQSSQSTTESVSASEFVEEIEEFKRIRIIYDEVNSSETKSISEYLHQPLRNNKIVYSMKDLHDIQMEMEREFKQSDNLSKSKVIKLSKVLSFRSIIPKTETPSVFLNNKSINKIKYDLVDSKGLDLASKMLSLFQFVSMGVNDNNNNYFLNSFNELVEYVTDTGILFELLEKITSPSLKELMVDMILNYCWKHWNQHGEANGKVIQSRTIIFRILCNLKIGVSSIESWGPSRSRNRIEFKVQTIMREITKRAKCNDYLELIPMISQAVEIIEAVSLKFIFYDMLLIILKSHHKCCMHDYLLDTHTDLKEVVQHGFWYKHERKLVAKTQEIFDFLVAVNGQIYSWYTEILQGRIYVSSASGVGPLMRDIPSEYKPTPPGGWKFVRK